MITHWIGNLTIENVNEVADRLKELLIGKIYTFVSCNELDRFKPNVKTGQKLEDNNPIRVWKGDYSTGIHVNDSYGVWGFNTVLHEGEKNENLKVPYIIFEGNQIRIEHRAPGGNILYWVVALEK
jgi:hypothetical protein